MGVPGWVGRLVQKVGTQVRVRVPVWMVQVVQCVQWPARASRAVAVDGHVRVQVMQPPQTGKPQSWACHGVGQP